MWSGVKTYKVRFNHPFIRFIFGIDTISGNNLIGIRAICALEADLSSLAHAIHMMERPNGEKYWKLAFKVAVAFGGTSISAALQWMEGVSFRIWILWALLTDI